MNDMAKCKSEGLLKEELSFIEELPKQIEIECPLCQQVMLDDPHLVSCCGHHFCGACIEKEKIENKLCPLCNEKEFQIFPDKGRLRIINGLQVNCTNKECQWKGELKSLQAHLNKGKREGECQFEKLECRHERCQETPYRKDIENHERRKCNQRNILCPYCQCILGTHEWITQDHYLQCTQYLIPCPNKCQNDKGFSRGNIEDHVSKECPLQPVECEFKWAGCHYNSLRKNLPQHNIDSQLNHMSLIAKACGELKKECQELTAMNKDLKRDSETLKKENETLKKDSEALKKDNEILKRNDSIIKLKLYSIHHALVGNDDPIVPFSIDLDKEKHFYTGICGRRMSVSKDDNQRLMFRVYKRDGGQSQPPVTEIIFDYGFDTHTITKDVCHSYRDDFDRDSNCSQEFVTNMEISPISSLFGKIFIVSIK